MRRPMNQYENSRRSRSSPAEAGRGRYPPWTERRALAQVQILTFKRAGQATQAGGQRPDSRQASSRA